jgi:hypothetical protein
LSHIFFIFAFCALKKGAGKKKTNGEDRKKDKDGGRRGWRTRKTLDNSPDNGTRKWDWRMENLREKKNIAALARDSNADVGDVGALSEGLGSNAQVGRDVNLSIAADSIDTNFSSNAVNGVDGASLTDISTLNGIGFDTKGTHIQRNTSLKLASLELDNLDAELNAVIILQHPELSKVLVHVRNPTIQLHELMRVDYSDFHLMGIHVDSIVSVPLRMVVLGRRNGRVLLKAVWARNPILKGVRELVSWSSVTQTAQGECKAEHGRNTFEGHCRKRGACR